MADQSGDMRKGLSRFKKFLFQQKYRFDLGYQFLAFINFSLLVITASDKLMYYTNIPRTWVLLVVFVPLAFAAVWVFGMFLDKVVRYSQAYTMAAAERNPLWDMQVAHMNRIEARLDQIQKKLS